MPKKRTKRKRKYFTFVKWLDKYPACIDAIEWVQKDCRGRLDIAWKRCTRPGWMIWLIGRALYDKLRGWSTKNVRKSDYYRRAQSFEHYILGRRNIHLANELRELFTPPRWGGGR